MGPPPIAASELGEALKRAEVRVQEARAEKLETENAERLGELVPRDEVTQRWNEGLRRIATRLESLPEECAMLLPADVRAAVVQELEEKVYLLLKEMAGWEPLD